MRTAPRALITSLLLLAVATSALARSPCEDLWQAEKPAPRWSMTNRSPTAKYEVSDFLPRPYLADLEAAGYTTKLKISFLFYRNEGSLKIFAENRAKTRIAIAELNFWPGKNSRSIVVEHFGLRNLISKGSGLHANQDYKGLPTEVSLYFKSRLYRFLSAGGYEVLNANSSQNYLVGTLYRRFLGGVQSEAGRRFSDYMTGLYKVASKSFPPELRPKGLDAFSDAIGDFRDRRTLYPFENSGDAIPLSELEGSAAKTKGGQLLRDPDSGEPVAFAWNYGLVYLYKEDDGYRPLKWSEINRRHPDWIRIEVPLPKTP